MRTGQTCLFRGLGQPRPHRQRNVVADRFRLGGDGTATLSASTRKCASVSVHRRLRVAPLLRPRKPGTGRGERGKTEADEHAGAAGIPRVENDEAPSLVKLRKRRT